MPAAPGIRKLEDSIEFQVSQGLLIHNIQFTPCRRKWDWLPIGTLMDLGEVLKCAPPFPFASWNKNRCSTKARAFILLELRTRPSI